MKKFLSTMLCAGMITGGRAGLYTVGVAWGFRQPEELKESGARAIIHEPGELLDFITGE